MKKFLLKIFAKDGGSTVTEDEEVYCDIYTPQQFSWDCGFACLNMALKWWKLQEVDIDDIIGSSKNTPLWTIDIYNGIRGNGLDRSIFYTSCVGIQQQHFGIEWYQAHIEEDAARVNRKFEVALENGWSVHLQILDIETISTMVEQGSRAIILIDNKSMKNERKSYDGYAGHYIFLVAYIREKNVFQYLDPARHGIQEVSSAMLEVARRHPGTDCDIIVIEKQLLSS